MKRLIPLVLALALGASLAQPAAARRVVVVHKGPHRTTVRVYHGWPLARPARVVIVHPAVMAVRVEPRVYLRPVIWTTGATVAVVASHPSADALSWTDSALLTKDEDWTEFTLNCGHRGTRLWYEVQSGKVQADWAEVVYGNGETQVVDFAEHTQDPGLYPLLDFHNGRVVDHVRIVARSKTEDARVALRLEN